MLMYEPPLLEYRNPRIEMLAFCILVILCLIVLFFYPIQ
ncbi:MAG: hypothetical protein RIS45_724 [Planctomycetota bacterium]|jgi:hypothetical protein